jgi:hypothetical protein
MRRIGVSLVREAICFDQALVRFDTEMRRLAARAERIRRLATPFSLSWNTPEKAKTTSEETPEKILSELNTPTEVYICYLGTWRSIGEIMRLRREVFSRGLYDEYWFSPVTVDRNRWFKVRQRVPKPWR